MLKKPINAKKPKTDNKIIVPFFIFFVVFLFVVPLNNLMAYYIDFKINGKFFDHFIFYIDH